MPSPAARALALPTSLAFAGGLATGLLVAFSAVQRRTRARLARRLARRRTWSVREADLTGDLLHLPAGLR